VFGIVGPVEKKAVKKSPHSKAGCARERKTRDAHRAKRLGLRQFFAALVWVPPCSHHTFTACPAP
jgi:hypothetical protein